MESTPAPAVFTTKGETVAAAVLPVPGPPPLPSSAPPTTLDSFSDRDASHFRVKLTPEQKAEIFDLRSVNGMSSVMIAEKYNIHERTVRKIVTKAQQQRDGTHENISQGNFSVDALPEVEGPVLASVKEAISNMAPSIIQEGKTKFSLTSLKAFVKAQAIAVKDQLLAQEDTPADLRSKLESFTASAGWIRKFFDRHHYELGKRQKGAFVVDTEPAVLSAEDRLAKKELLAAMDFDANIEALQTLQRNAYALNHNKLATSLNAPIKECRKLQQAKASNLVAIAANANPPPPPTSSPPSSSSSSSSPSSSSSSVPSSSSAAPVSLPPLPSLAVPSPATSASPLPAAPVAKGGKKRKQR